MSLWTNHRFRFSILGIFPLVALTLWWVSQIPFETQAAAVSLIPPQEQITLAVKYVSYTNEQQQPVVSSQKAKKVIKEINQIYAPCAIQFQVQDYLAEDPETHGLDFGPSFMSDLESIREKFDTPQQLVIINTGNWNHAGGLGADGANAWTTMPGRRPAGAVIENKVATTSSLIAHELGHYLNLNHVKERTNLMNPIIYRETIDLTREQCQVMRKEAQKSPASRFEQTVV